MVVYPVLSYCLSQFYDDLNEVWKPKEFEASADTQLSLYQTNYIVIGPISHPLQIVTGWHAHSNTSIGKPANAIACFCYQRMCIMWSMSFGSVC